MPEAPAPFLHANLLTSLTHFPIFKTRYVVRKKFAALNILKAYVIEPKEWKFNFTIRQGPKDGDIIEFWVGLTAQYKNHTSGVAEARYTKVKRLLMDESQSAGRWTLFSHSIESNIEHTIGYLGIDFLKETGHTNIGLLSERGRQDFETLEPPPEELEYDEDIDTDDYNWSEDED